MAENDFIILVIAALMLIHLAIGLPLFVVLGLGALAMIEFTGVYSLSVLGEVPFSAMDNWALLAMPLFILAGDIIGSGKIARQLVDIGEALIGWIRGGLGMATIFGCFLFAGTSGSSSADTVAIGRIMIPSMREKNYNGAYAAALVASGGCLGVIVPPSIIMIIYGVLTATSVGDLFLGGILPGLTMAFAMCVVNYGVCIASSWGVDDRRKFRLGDVAKAIWTARYGLGTPVLILGGIYGGLFTPTEAAAIAVAYCFFVEVVVMRSLSIREIASSIVRSGIITGMIAPIIAFSALFGEVLAIHRIPERMSELFLGLPVGPGWSVMLLIALLLAVGCVLEPIAAIVIMMPVLLPVGAALGFDPVHFGVLVVCTLSLGFITPPMGINLFAASAVSGEPFMRIALKAIPIFVGTLVSIVLIAEFPQLVLWFR